MTDKLSNARIRTLGGYLPVYKIEVTNKKDNIWRGVPIKQFGQREEAAPFVYFTREYNPDINDFDKIYPEINITDRSILGVEFWLIPKDKLLFAYEPGSSIIELPKVGHIPFKRPQ